MKHLNRILLLLLLSTIMSVSGQVNPRTACRVENDRIIFTVDLGWTLKQRQEISKLFDLDSMVLVQVWAGKTDITYKGAQWKVNKITPKIVELSKPLDRMGISETREGGDLILIDDRMGSEASPPPPPPPPHFNPESVPYGVNKLTRHTSFRYLHGTGHFFLPGKKDARQVYLSGTFNSWSTAQLPMQRTDSGWICSIKLKPGKYQYKYIIDGRWSEDPYNRMKQDDLHGGMNSVIFCYNFWFRLAGYETAKRVVVSGSFNSWREEELPMIKGKSGWMINLYLREGTHAYKFIVNGMWILDPACRVNRPDGDGHVNSFVGVGDSVMFTLKGYPLAKAVVLSGNFNAWNKAELLMNKTAGGWQLAYALAPGIYEYKFIVDGDWITDPANPVRSGPGEDGNAILVAHPNHTFRLPGNSAARNVYLAGSFNNWNPQSYPMRRQGDAWIFPIRLEPGKYLYKFVVDNKWILDPTNEIWEENEYGTGNSVLWIEP